MSHIIYDEAGRQPRDVTDEFRAHGPVIQSTSGEWVILGHAEAVQVATDPDTFSSKVSRFLQLPNGLDGEEHARFRALIDRYFAHERMAALRPGIEEIARQMVAELPRGTTLNAVRDIGATFAVRGMTRWLGWPRELEPELLGWVRSNYEATRSGDLERTRAVAVHFDEIIMSVITPRREDPSIDDVTAELVHDESLGRPLTDPELVSILRNWTGGDLGSMALSVGVITHGLTVRPELQDRFRHGSDAEVDAIMNELLRIDNPFVSNRRVTTCPVSIGGRDVPGGARVRINWTSANRDEKVFRDGFEPEAHAPDNLVFGRGPHYCPGEELTIITLRALFRELMRGITSLELDGEAERGMAPVGGFVRLPVRLG